VICCDQTVYNPVPGNPLTGTTPSGGSSQISVCWEVSLNGVNWTSLYCGSTSNSYQLPSGQDGIKFYRRVASDNVSQNVSNQVQVTYVNTIPLGSDFGNPLPIGTYSSNDCSYTTKVVNSLGSEYENQIGDSRKDVFFYFNVVTDPTGVKFSFTTCDSDTDTKLYLFDSNQNLIASAETGSDLSLGCGQGSIKADLYSTFLPVGSYYLVVEGDGNLELDIATVLYGDCVDLYEQQYVTPQAPTNLTSDNISTTGFTLGWTGPSGNATGYKIYKNDQYLETVTTTTSYIQGLSPNTTYSFKVSTYNLGGESPLSAAKTVTTSPPMGSDFGHPLPIGTYHSNDCSYTTKVVNSLDGYENQIGDSRKDVFFYFNVATDPTGVKFAFTTCDSDTDTKLYLFDSNQNLITSTETGSDLSLGCGQGSIKADLYSALLPVGLYYVVVEGDGNLELDIATTLYSDCFDLYEQQNLRMASNAIEHAELESTVLSDEIIVYPNPTVKDIFVTGVSDFDAILYDPASMVWISVPSTDGVIDLSKFKNGYYLLKIKTAGRQYAKRILKQ
jgi:chitodextrinase